MFTRSCILMLACMYIIYTHIILFAVQVPVQPALHVDTIIA